MLIYKGEKCGWVQLAGLLNFLLKFAYGVVRLSGGEGMWLD